MYHETEYAIKRLTSLRKHLYTNQPEAYAEVTNLLNRLTEYITVSARSTPTNLPVNALHGEKYVTCIRGCIVRRFTLSET
jgi:hypothetical protein